MDKPTVTEELGQSSASLAKIMIDADEEQERIKFLKATFIAIACVGFNGISVDIMQCPNHSNEYYIQVIGLGHTLHMIYWFNDGLQFTMMRFLAEIYQDFAGYVMIERNELTHETVH